MQPGPSAEQALRTMLADRNLRFPERPCLVADLNIFQMPEGLGVQFRGAESPVIIRGPQAELVLTYLVPALDGSRTLEDLLAQCPQSVPRPTLLRTLALLHTKGLLAGAEAAPLAQEGPQASDELIHRQLLFWGRKLGITMAVGSAPEIQQRLERAQLVLIGSGLFGATTYDVLRRSGCNHVQALAWDDNGSFAKAVADDPTGAGRLTILPSTVIEEAHSVLQVLIPAVDLVVTATRHAPAEFFALINRICLERSCPWLRGNEDGMEVEIGPYVRPYESACFRCLELRQISMQDFAVEEQLYQRHLAKPRPAGLTLPAAEALPVATLAASLVTMEVVRIITGIAIPTLLNTVMTVNPLTGAYRTNRILRVPRCPECYRGTIAPSAREAVHG
jgi:bacteriocin biosynthesis cyclodehydratase domain-containing protein